MPPRTVASTKQREVFAAISMAKNLVFAMKNHPDANKDSVSINAHGCFHLFDKYWANAGHTHHETLIAFSASDSIALTPTTEPIVHFHIDWSRARYVIAKQRAMTLIGADKEIVFCFEQNPASRLFWFYFYRWEDVEDFEKSYKRDWINLSPPE